MKSREQFKIRSKALSVLEILTIEGSNVTSSRARSQFAYINPRLCVSEAINVGRGGGGGREGGDEWVEMVTSV